MQDLSESRTLSMALFAPNKPALSLIKWWYQDLTGGAHGKCRRCKRWQVRSLGGEDPLEKEMATHSSILAWRIPWTEESSGLPSIGVAYTTEAT